MKTHANIQSGGQAERPGKDPSHPVDARDTSHSVLHLKQLARLTASSPATMQMRRLQPMATNSPQSTRLHQLASMANTRTATTGPGPVIQALGWETLGVLNPRRYIPEAVGGYTPEQMAENGLVGEQAPSTATAVNATGEQEQTEPESDTEPDSEPDTESDTESDTEEEADDASSLKEQFQALLQTIQENEGKLVLAYFAAMLLWQRYYRQAQGKPGRGRAERGLEQLSALNDELHGFKKKASKYSATSGFKDGIDIRPMGMPVEAYSRGAELISAWFQIYALIMATPEEIDAHLKRINRYAIRKKAPKKLRLRGKKSRGIGAKAAEERKKYGYGFSAGLAAGTFLTWSVPILGSSWLSLQSVWDAFHVVDAFARKAKADRKKATGITKKLMLFQQRDAERLGRAKLYNHLTALPRQVWPRQFPHRNTLGNKNFYKPKRPPFKWTPPRPQHDWRGAVGKLIKKFRR